MSPFYTGDGSSDLAHNLGASKLVSHPSGLFTVAVCVMSNYRDENEWLLHLTNTNGCMILLMLGPRVI